MRKPRYQPYLDKIAAAQTVDDLKQLRQGILGYVRSGVCGPGRGDCRKRVFNAIEYGLAARASEMTSTLANNLDTLRKDTTPPPSMSAPPSMSPAILILLAFAALYLF